MTNYFIGIGGTGARCLEALTYLAAAGLLTENINVLLIDPDANNGNNTATNNLLASYHILNAARQPENPETEVWTLMGRRRKLLPAPTLFKAGINDGGQRPVRWNIVQQNTGRQFSEVIHYTSCPEKLKQFINLFYHPDDLQMRLDVGYQGRTNVGSVALKHDLEETTDTSGVGLREFLEALAGDLEQETKVFVAGSIFGGTGAAGIPTIPAMVRQLRSDFFPEENRSNIRWGTALMSPYFSFPQRGSAGENFGPGTNSTLHPIAAKAAMLYYAYSPPGYNHVYLMGAPNRVNTNPDNEPGGEGQRNAPHYIELVSALSAMDFFSRGSIGPGEKYLHFADSFVERRADLGVCWETLPVFPNNAGTKREVIKRKLVSFTTFAYVYHKILHEPFILNNEYAASPMYNDNFVNKALSLEPSGETQVLDQLNSFCGNYLGWLEGISRTAGDNSAPLLFNWEALSVNNVRACEERVGNLMQQGTLINQVNALPRYSNTGYAKIMDNLTRLKLVSPGTQSAAGLFIYLLSQAVEQFCKDNYKWS
jgi:hypothetical protein